MVAKHAPPPSSSTHGKIQSDDTGSQHERGGWKGPFSHTVFDFEPRIVIFILKKELPLPSHQ